MIIKVNDRILICRNPHAEYASNILGRVIAIRKGHGFAGSDLVDVKYNDPKTGETVVLPFGMACLGLADTESLIALAEENETRAQAYRRLAGQENNGFSCRLNDLIRRGLITEAEARYITEARQKIGLPPYGDAENKQ